MNIQYVTHYLLTIYPLHTYGWTDNNNEIQRQKVGEAVLFPHKGETKMLRYSQYSSSILEERVLGYRQMGSVGTITTYRKNKPGETVMEKKEKEKIATVPQTPLSHVPPLLLI